MTNAVSVELIVAKILLIRGKKVMSDADLAKLYGVPTKRLNEQVKRNRERFPKDFIFQLTKAELDSLRSHFATLNTGSKRGKHVKYLSYVFTQEGVAMLSSVLNSRRAIQVNIAIMRAFVKMRYLVSANRQFDMKLRELEDRLDLHDKDIRDIFAAIRQLIGIPSERRKIKGFTQK